MRLNDLQQLCGQALTGPNPEQLSDWIARPEPLINRHSPEHKSEHATGDRPDLDAHQRLAIYRNNSEAVRASALTENYALTRRWLGDEYFDAAARRYARQTPARSSDLNAYGAGFADWLVDLPGLAEQSPPAVDLARLDWQRHELGQLVLADGESAVRGLRSVHPLDEIYAACAAPGGQTATDDLPEASEPELTAEPAETERCFLLMRSGTANTPPICQAVDAAVFAAVLG